ncbi:hypothetical protein KAU33_00575 [Candidatus Dependentiae bacterium]|nr:hypothetical protein [Candidatus Dependentiae bacterium]
MEKILKKIVIFTFLIICVISVNLFIQKYFDITIYIPNMDYHISIDDQEFLKSINKEINLVAFIEKDKVLQRKLENIFRILHSYNNKIKVDIIRTDLNPQLIKKYGVYKLDSALIKTDDNFIFVDFVDILRGIKTCLRKELRTIFFSTGHNELDLQKERKGFVKFLRENGYSLTEFNENSAELTNQVLLIPGLSEDLKKDELLPFLKNGNSVIILLGRPLKERFSPENLKTNSYELENLQILLDKFNLTIEDFSYDDYELDVMVESHWFIDSEIKSITLYDPKVVKEGRYILRDVKTFTLLRGRIEEQYYTFGMLSEWRIIENYDLKLRRLIVIGDCDFLKDSRKNIRVWYFLYNLIRYSTYERPASIHSLHAQYLIISQYWFTTKNYKFKMLYIIFGILPFLIFLVRIRFRKKLFIP